MYHFEKSEKKIPKSNLKSSFVLLIFDLFCQYWSKVSIRITVFINVVGSYLLKK